jgi:hypothetical protein
MTPFDQPGPSRRTLVWILLALAIGLGFLMWKVDARADEPTTAQSGVLEASKPAPRRGLLYQVSKDGRNAYLFGTVHAGTPDFYPLSSDVMAAATSARAIAFEVDLNDTRNAEVMKQLGYFPAGQGRQVADRRVSEAALNRVLKRYGIAREQVADYRPWWLALNLISVSVIDAGFDFRLGNEAFLLNLAERLDKKVLALESIRDQLSIFADLSPADQERFLEAAVEAIENGEARRETRKAILAWASGDKGELEWARERAVAVKGDLGKRLERRLFSDRHAAMAKRIDQFLVDGHAPLFVAVGVLHLVGPDSLLEVLKKAGYSVQAL